MNHNTLIPASLPTNDKIRAIAMQSALNLIDLITAHEKELNAALCETEEGPITIGHSIKIDLSKNTQTDKLSFALKTSDEITGDLSDPDQPNLSFGEDAE